MGICKKNSQIFLVGNPLFGPHGDQGGLKKERNKETNKQRKLEWLKTSNLTENRDTAGSVSKFDTSKLIDFHNTV